MSPDRPRPAFVPMLREAAPGRAAVVHAARAEQVPPRVSLCGLTLLDARLVGAASADLRVTCPRCEAALQHARRDR